MSDVDVTVTLRHPQTTRALKDYAEKKVLRISKFFSRPLDTHDILSVDARIPSWQKSGFYAHGSTIRVKEQRDDFDVAIDLAVDQIERQFKKEKSKLNRRKPKQ